MGLMSGIALALAIGGTTMSVRGQLQAGRAAKEAGESAAQREEFNAGIARQQAADAIARGADEESRFRAGVRGLIGSQRAGFAGQGVVAGFGSAADVQADAAFLGELDARQIRANAAREAWGFEVEAQDREKAADVARKGGQVGAAAARTGAIGTVLGTGANLMMSRYGWDRRVTTQRAA